MAFMRALASCRKGMSGVEFALMAPIFLLILAAVVDLGGMLNTKFRLNAAVSSSANYALANEGRVTASSVPSLLEELATIAAGASGGNNEAITVSANDGPAVLLSAGAFTHSGTASKADLCYCPSIGGGGAVTWGDALKCEAPCPSGGYSGKFIRISASQPFTPMFGGFGFIDADGRVSVQATVNIQ